MTCSGTSEGYESIRPKPDCVIARSFRNCFPYLRDAYNERPDDVEPCIHKYNNLSGLGTLLNRVIESAGVTPWPKTFQNLRSTRRTELQRTHKDHVINSWLGHSGKIAEKHYLQITDEDWESACGVTPWCHTCTHTDL